MRRDLITLILTAVVLFVQITIIPIFTDYNIMLPIVYLACMTIYCPFRTILINAFLIGVMQDNMSVGMYGFHLCTALLLAYIFLLVRSNIGLEGRYVPITITGAFLLVYNLIFIVWSLVLGYIIVSPLSFIVNIVAEILLGMLVSWPVAVVLRRLEAFLNED